MKISNVKQIKILCYVNISVVTILIFLLFIPHRAVLTFAIFISVILLLVILLNLRFTVVEDSGGCFTISKIHPLAQKGYFSPQIEFPISSIQYCRFAQGIFNCHISIKIITQVNNKSIHFNLLLFNKEQIKYITSSLNKISYKE